MAIVAVPFFMLLFGLVGIATHFFVATSIERGIEMASRLVRTGQAQSTAMTVDDFKKKICVSAGAWIKCDKVQLHVQSFAGWDTVAPQACLNSGGGTIGSALPGGQPIATSTGGADRIVLVTVCYEWEFAQALPYIRLGRMPNGSMMMQTATVFRTEPYSAS